MNFNVELICLNCLNVELKAFSKAYYYRYFHVILFETHIFIDLVSRVSISLRNLIVPTKLIAD